MAPTLSQAPRRPLAAGIAALVALALVSSANAGSLFWSGDNNAFWNTTAGVNGTNWSSSPGFNNGTITVPGAADDVFFNIPGAINLATQLGVDFSIRSLTFTPVATNAISIGGGNTLTLGSGGMTDNAGAAITLNTNVALGAAQTWANNSADAVTVNGIISGGAPNDLTIGGSGAFTFTSANTYAGSTTIFTGTLNLSGANGSLQSTSGITLNAGTTLVLDNASANNSNRLNDNTTITTRGGILSLVGNAGATTEAAGTLSVGSGASVVQVSGSGSSLTFGRAPADPSPLASFSRTGAGGTANFVVGAGASIKAPNVTLVNGIIGGWAVTGTAAGTGLDWATTDVSKNIVPYSAYTALTADATGTITSAIAATDNTKFDATGNNSVRIQANTAINSLYMTGGSTLSGVTGGPTNNTFYNGITFGTGVTANLTITLTVGTGGIISSGATGIGHYNNKTDIPDMAFIGYQFGEFTAAGQTNGDAGQITAGAGVPDLIVYTDSNLRIASRIVDNGGPVGLTKSGPGLLDLSNGNTQTNKPSNTFTGKVAINEGILLIGQANQLGNSAAASDNVTFNGGELRTFAGLTTATTQGWTVGTRGGTFAYTGGGTSNIQNKITGTGGFTFYARSAGGGTNELINLANNLAVGGGGNADYQGPTRLWFSISDGSFGSGTQYGRIAWTQNNQIPASSAVTMDIVDDTPDHNVLPNFNNVSANLAGRNDHFGSLAGNVNLRNFSGTLTIGANNLSTDYTGSLYGAAAQTNGGDTTFPAGTGTLIKVGSGTQIFGGTLNNYTGATTINGGTLLIGDGTDVISSAILGSGAVNVGNGTLIGALGGNGTIFGVVNVSSTGHLAPAMSATTTNTLTIANNLTINAGATLDYNFGAAGTPGMGDLIDVTGAGNLLMNAGTDILNITALPGFGVGTYSLITVSGFGSFTDNATFTINGSTLFNYSVLKPGDAIAAAAGGGTVPSKQLWLQVLAGNPSFFWTGAVNGAWDVNTTSNWTGAGAKFANGGNVTFDDVNLSVAPPGATNLTVAAGGVTANSIVFNNALNNFTIGGGAITVTAGSGVTKNQAGSVTFNGTVTTPLTTITAGTLNIGSTATYNSTLKVDLNSGALNVNGTLNTATLNVKGGTNLNVSATGSLGGATVLNVDGAATFNNASQTVAGLGETGGANTGVVTLTGTALGVTGSSTYDGTITGTGSLIKSTGGMLVLTNGANSFSGGTTISGGTLLLTNTTGSATGAGSVTISSSGILAGTRIGGSLVSNAGGTFSPGTGAPLSGDIGTFNVGGGITINAGSVLDFDLTSPGVADTVNSTGALSLGAGVNTILNLFENTGFAVGSYVLFTASSVTNSSTYTINPSGPGMASGATYAILAVGNTLVLNVTAAPTVTWTGATNGNWDTTTLNWAPGGTFANANAVVFDNTGANTNITVVAAGVVSSGMTFNNTVAVPYTIGGGVISGSAGITKNNTGIVTLTGANAFTGTTTINGGTVSISADENIGMAPGAPRPDAITLNGGTLSASVSFILSANRGIALGSGGGTFDVADGAILNYDGVIANVPAQSGSLTKTGAGTLALAGAVASTYTAGTTINGGTVSIVADNNLGAAPGAATPGAIILAGGTLSASATLTLNANRGIALASIGGTLDVVGGATLSYAGVMANLGAQTGLFTKSGFGTLTLAGAVANSYTGTTTVTGGTLNLGYTGGNSVPANLTANGGASVILTAANQIADSANVVIGDLTNGANIRTGANADTINSLSITVPVGSGYGVGNPTTSVLSNLNILGTLSVTNGEHDFVNSNSTVTSNALIMDGSTGRLGANTNPSTVTVGAGGLSMTNAQLRLGTNGAGFAATVNLGGNFTGSGTNNFLVNNFSGLRQLNLQGATRTFNILDGNTTVEAEVLNGGITKTGDGTLILSGPQSYDTLNANAGVTSVTGSFIAGTATVNVAALLDFDSSQTIAALNIGTGVLVALDEFGGDSSLLHSPGGVQAVPEPASASLLLLGLLSLGGCCRRSRG